MPHCLGTQLQVSTVASRGSRPCRRRPVRAQQRPGNGARQWRWTAASAVRADTPRVRWRAIKQGLVCPGPLLHAHVHATASPAPAESPAESPAETNRVRQRDGSRRDSRGGAAQQGEGAALRPRGHCCSLCWCPVPAVPAVRTCAATVLPGAPARARALGLVGAGAGALLAVGMPAYGVDILVAGLYMLHMYIHTYIHTQDMHDLSL